MIIENYIPKKNIYTYITWEGEIYILKEKLNYTTEELQQEKNYTRIKEELERKSISTQMLQNEKEIKKRKIRDSFLITYSLGILLSGIIFMINNKYDLKNQYKIWKYKWELSKNNEKELEILKEIQQNNFPKEILDELIYEGLFDEKLPKETEFYSWISYSISQNPYMNNKEKEELIIHYKDMLEEYGSYFNSKTMLKTITSLSENEIERRYGCTLNVTVHNAGEENQDLIIYNPYDDALGHESEHTNQPNTISSVYSEARSGYLDGCNSYPRARALFTMLGHLGNEETTLKCIINGENIELWEKIRRRLPQEYHYKIDYLKNLVEKIDVDFLNYKSDTYQLQEEILKIIEELYQIIYLKPYTEDASMYVLTEVFKKPNTMYKTTDHLILEGIFPVTINLLPDVTCDLEIPLDYSSYENLINQQLDIIFNYLKKDEIEKKEYYYKASFWVEMYLGRDNYRNLMIEPKKIDAINNFRMNIDIEKIHQIINYLYNEDYEKMINIYINPQMQEFYLNHNTEFVEIIDALSSVTPQTEKNLLNRYGEELQNTYERLKQMN